MGTVALTVEREAAAADDAAAAVEVLRAAMRRLDAPAAAELSLVLTGDDRLQDLNCTYRDIDRPTDVLSFPSAPEDLPPGAPPYLGDILISVPRAAAQAEEAGHALADELRLLAVHGLLHLLGYDDETEAGAAEMRRLEAELGVREADEATPPGAP